MERFGPPARRDPGPIPTAGSSSGSSNEQHPERAYGVDLRYLDKEEKSIAGRADTDNTVTQRRVRKFLASAKAAGKYQQDGLIAEPQIKGHTPRVPASINGSNVPTLGDRIGTGGSVNYARKPELRSGKFVGFT